MINHPAFPVEPWCLRETDLDVEVLAQTESVFALSNGHIGWRGNLDEGEPHGLPGSYLNGVYELRPLPYAEAGYGYPESGQTVINVTNGKLIRLLVDDEPFDIRYGELRAHERVPRLPRRRAAPQRRLGAPRPGARCGFLDPAGVAGAALDRRDPLRGRGRSTARCGVVVQSELVANEQLPAAGGDPRVAAALEAPLVAEADAARVRGPGWCTRTRHSGLRIAAVMDHVVDGPPDTAVAAESFARPGPGDGDRDAAARAAAAAGQVRRLRLVGIPVAARGARPGRRRAGRGRADRMGRAAGRAAGLPRRRSGTGPTSSSTATPRSSRPCGSRCSTCCRPAPGPRAARSPPRA